ncbi:MAG TPA: AbrB/MazE/SpoVT family DNA-binding domain-containing protein [Burkholderiaceae bacterium]
MQVSRWGNSLAIRLPASVVEVLDLKEGDQVEVEVANARTLRVGRTDAGDAQALARLRQLRGVLPPDFKFDRMEANERGR